VLLLHGETGIGLRTVAEHLAGSTFLLVQPRTSKGELDRENGTISIEQVRTLYEQTRTGGIEYIIIDNAERLSTEAQNAFLKLLEEPPANVHFMLTAHSPDQLLSTVRSRVTRYHVPPITLEQSQQLLEGANLTAAQRAQALFLAAGRPARLITLRDSPDTLELHSKIMGDARRFLSDPSRYNRLATALRYGTSRSEALKLVGGALQIMKHTLNQSATKPAAETAEQLLRVHSALRRNANPRLQLARFVLQ